MSTLTYCCVAFTLANLICCTATVIPVKTVAPQQIEQLTWEDQAFDYEPSLIQIRQQDLFTLGNDLVEKITQSATTELSKEDNVNRMLTIIFGEKQSAFPYFPGHTTVASQTWKNKYGDCISLTLLTYAVSKAMNLPVSMQEVRVPAMLDRRENVDFINDHVNLFIENHQPVKIRNKIYEKNIVIDFDVDNATSAGGISLTEDGITARFYNNLAAAYLAKNQMSLAYAYFKEAILVDPGYAPSYSNLAQLYKRRNFLDLAEKLLRYSLTKAPGSYINLTSLRDLMIEEHRTNEARQYADQLKNLRERDPYYWLGVGVGQIRSQQFFDAIDSLEKASEMAQGFAEIHANLALAYWRTNQPEKARAQLALLKGIQPESPGVIKLSKKFQ